MRCEYCDREIQNIPKDRMCPHCGAQLPAEETTAENACYPEPPLGRYEGTNGYIEVHKDSLTLCFVDGLTKKVINLSIPFSEIEEVKIIPGGKWLPGKLWVRDIKKKNLFFTTVPIITYEPRPLVFKKEQNRKMQELHNYLQYVQRSISDKGRK